MPLRWEVEPPGRHSQSETGNEELGTWLINPQDKQVEIYRQNQEVEVLQSPTSLSGEDVLPGLVLDLQPIF